MTNGDDIWEEKRKKIKEELEKGLEDDDDSDIPIHEKHTKKGDKLEHEED